MRRGIRQVIDRKLLMKSMNISVLMTKCHMELASVQYVLYVRLVINHVLLLILIASWFPVVICVS